jgi:hypothetical protein
MSLSLCTLACVSAVEGEELRGNTWLGPHTSLHPSSLMTLDSEPVHRDQRRDRCQSCPLQSSQLGMCCLSPSVGQLL